MDTKSYVFRDNTAFVKLITNLYLLEILGFLFTVIIELKIITGFAAIILALLGMIFLIGGIIAGILFYIWVYRTNRNLHARGITMEFTPGWAVGYFFIPILGLYKPYKMLKEIRSKSDVSESKEEFLLLKVFWAFYILTAFITIILFRLKAIEVRAIFYVIAPIEICLKILLVKKISSLPRQKSIS